jgi:cysteine desulfurase / selenocysteine lyase
MTFTQLKPLATRTRPDFPILNQAVNGNPLVYLDNAATSQKPNVVLDALFEYYRQDNANVHRGAHTLSGRATDAYEGARDKVAAFVNAASRNEIVYTRNATEAINLVAYAWGMNTLQPGDEIILSVMEHHSNLVPWQMVAQKTGAILKFVELDATEGFDFAQFQSLLSAKTKLVAVVHVSNTLGCINPAKAICTEAHRYGAKVLIDACQSAPHLQLDVQDMDCDWLVASGHKMCAPTGIGFSLWQAGSAAGHAAVFGWWGNDCGCVLDHSTYADLPHKFEAGTPAIGEAIALGAAIDYLTHIGMDNIHAYEAELTAYLFRQLQQLPTVRVYGPPPHTDGSGRAALAGFYLWGCACSGFSHSVGSGGDLPSARAITVPNPCIVVLELPLRLGSACTFTTRRPILTPLSWR